MEHIRDIVVKIGVGEENLEYYGNYKAKVSLDLLHRSEGKEDGELVLVAAINPTKAGEGEPVMTAGLGDALNRLGKKMMIAPREPNLDPVFGLKGGTVGGGYVQVVPVEDISLHFTGDIHAITTANDLIPACLDNHIHQGNGLDIDIESITWRRCPDMNDCTLHHITIGQGPEADGVERVDDFNTTVASEMMAVPCLSTSLMDLKERLSNMLVASNSKKGLIYVKDLGIERALAVVTKDAVKLDMVWTLGHNPVLTHGGPFADVAHGCNSILATGICLKLTNHAVTEAGFGANLEAGKFLDIKCHFGGLKPNAMVVVTIIRVSRQHGNVACEGLKNGNMEVMLTGCENLAEYIDTVRQSGLPYIVTINEFASDTPAEVEALQNWYKEHQHPVSLSQVWAKDGEDALDLADQLVKLYAEENSCVLLCDME